MSTVRNAWSAADESRSRRDPSGPWSKEAGPQRCTKQWSSWFADFYTIPFGRNLHDACSLYTVRVFEMYVSLYTVRVFEMYVNSQVCMYMDVCIHIDIHLSFHLCPHTTFMSTFFQIAHHVHRRCHININCHPCILWVAPWKP